MGSAFLSPIIKGILFDFDGVLAKTMEDHFTAWKAALDSFGISLKEEEYYPLEGMAVNEIAKRYCYDNNLNESCALQILQKKEEYYSQNHFFEFYPGVEELIKLLHSKGIKLGIVSGGLQQRIIKSVPPDFLNMFKTIITSDKTKRGKPFPDPYLKGLQELQLKPEECLVVENAPLGIKAAKNAGVYCIAIASTVSKKKLVEADEVVDCFEELFQTKIITNIP